MRILLLNQVFYPDVAATAQHAHDLARHLVEHGHDVSVIASRSIYGERGATLPKHEIVDGIEIHRVGRSLFGKAGLAARLLDFAIFYLAAVWNVLTIRHQDVVICFTTPPFIALVGGLLKLLRGSKTVYWIMDMYPEVLVASGALRPRSIVARALESVSRLCMRCSDRIVVLGRCMRQRVLDKHVVNPQRVVHLGVWSDHEEIKPIARKDNPYRKQWELGDRFVVMYSGNFGLVHDVHTMCRAAELLRDESDIAFVFVGGGKRKAEVETFVKTLGLEARLEPYQPRERLDALLTCADMHVVTLLPGFEGMVVPSKLFGVMAAARPAIVIGPKSSEISLVVQASGCGAVIPNGDAEALANVIRALADKPKKAREIGERGRAALQAQHSRAYVCEQWRKLLEGLVAAPSTARVRQR